MVMLAESYCDWWSLAGIDTLVGEQPAAWLSETPTAKPVGTLAKSPAPAADSTSADSIIALMTPPREPESAPVKAPSILPPDWEAFQRWLGEGEDVPGSQWDARRILPGGGVAAPLMLLCAWPEVDDLNEGSLFAGAAGRLLDAMLRAIGIERSTCYSASLAVTRPPGGRCSDEEADELQRLLRHHLMLARPGRLLLIGSDILTLAAETTPAEARAKWLDIAHDGGSTRAIAVASPAMLLARPAQKAAAWDSLKLFLGDY